MIIGTHFQYRNRGYAYTLIQYVIDKMLEEDMHIFKAETRESNIPMQKVFNDFGYKMINKVEEYYDHPTETASSIY